MNLNLESPTFLNYKISSKCHEQSEAQKLRWKIKSVHCSVQCLPDLQIYQMSFEPSNEQIQKWNSQFVTKEIFPVGTWKIFWLN